jgi:coatomer subunit beta'
VYWSGTGSLVAITSEDSFYILRFDREAYNAKIDEGAEITDEGVEEAFDVVADVSEKFFFSSLHHALVTNVNIV